MNLLECFVVFGTGILSGVLFFGNLRWSIGHLRTSRFPVLTYGANLLARMLLIISLAWWALQTGVLTLLVGLAGFTISRILFVTRTTTGLANPVIGKRTSHG